MAELSLREELALTQKKLQEYADRVTHLSNELRTLRENICKSCKAKLAPHSLSSEQVSSAATAAPESSPKETQVQPASFWRRIWQRHAPPVHVQRNSPIYTASPASYLNIDPISFTLLSPISLKKTPLSIVTASLSSPLTAPSSNNSPSRLPTWSVQQDDETLDATLHISFARSFIHKGRIRSVRFSPDGKHLAALLRSSTKHSTGAIVFFDIESGEKTCALIEHSSPHSSKETFNVLCMCFSPNGKYLVVGDTTGRVTVWDVPNRRIRNIFTSHTNSIESVDFSPTSHLVASASIDKTIRIWSMRDGSSQNVLSHSVQGLWSVKFSPDGSSIVAGNSAGVLMLWDVRTGKLVDTWAGHRRVVLNVVFTKDGRGLVSGSGDGVVKYWDISGCSGVREILEYKGHTSVIKCISISPDARWVASASYDKTAIVWDTKSAIRQCTLVGHQDAVVSVDFSSSSTTSPKGTSSSSSSSSSYIVTASQDGHATLWRYYY